MKQANKSLKNQNGQLLIESVLLIIILMGAVMVVSRAFNDNEILRTLFQGPWTHVQGMAEHGSWAPPREAKKSHPNYRDRHSTVMGDER